MKEKMKNTSTIILGPTKSNTDVVVFESNLIDVLKSDEREWFEDSSNYVYGLEKLDNVEFKTTIQDYENVIDFVSLENYIPKNNIYILQVPSQETLYYLKKFLPNEDFVSFKRWGTTEEMYYEEAYRTTIWSDKIWSDEELDEIPNMENYDLEELQEDFDFDYWVPNELRIFRQSDYENIVQNYGGGMLNLNVDNYKKHRNI
jgi:hypothetical protein